MILTGLVLGIALGFVFQPDLHNWRRFRWFWRASYLVSAFWLVCSGH